MRGYPWWLWLTYLVILALGVWLTYLIGTSDLPLWLKFLVLG